MREPVFVVVDDPDGHVTPSPGVEIVGRRVGMIGHYGFGNIALMGKSLAIESMMLNAGPERLAKVMKREEIEFPRDIEPHGRKKARKSKQRLKGLRP